MLRFALNDSMVEIPGHPGLPALDYLRDQADLKGVKHACREGDCGSCVVLLGRSADNALSYQCVTSCLLPLGALNGHHVVTVEGLNAAEPGLFQTALGAEGGSQCGFCTPGFVVSFAGHLIQAREWKTDLAVEAVAGNICRCTGYTSIVRAMDTVIERMRTAVDPNEPRIPALVREKCLPDYFLDVPTLLSGLTPAAPDRVTASKTIIAGGTDLYVQRPDELDESEVVVLPPLSGPPIREDGDRIYLAGSTTAEDLKQSTLLAAAVGDLSAAMTLMGSLPIRNRATIAGNLVNASPIGDMTIVLLALDAEIGLAEGESRRSLPLREFFLAYKKLDLRPAELVEWVRFNRPTAQAFFNFEKVSKRTHLDIATVNTAIAVEIKDAVISSARVSAGGVAPVPMLLVKTAASMLGREPSADTAEAAARIAGTEVNPISDVRGSADYKRLLLGQLLLAHFNMLFGVEDFSTVSAAS